MLTIKKNLLNDKHMPVYFDGISIKKWRRLIYSISYVTHLWRKWYHKIQCTDIIVLLVWKMKNCHTFLCTFSLTDSICNRTEWTDSTASAVRPRGIAITIILWRCSLSMSLLISLWILCGPKNYTHQNHCSRVIYTSHNLYNTITR